MKKKTPKVREIYIRTKKGAEEPSFYISSPMLMCAMAILGFLVFIALIQLLIGWGPIFNKLFAMMGIS